MLKQTYEILIQRQEFFINLSLEHLFICTICVIFASIIGGGLGALMHYKKPLQKPLLGAINFLYTIPSIAMLGLFIPLFGIGNTTAIAALILYALLPIATSVNAGLGGVDSKLLHAARAMGATEFEIFYKVTFPLAFGVIFAGFRTMVVMSIALAGVASFVGAGGLGVAIYRGITTNNLAMVCAGSLLIAGMALVSDFLLASFAKIRTKALKIALLTAFVLSPFVLAKNPAQNELKIATKPMTEQYILANVLQILLAQQGINASISQGIGGGTFNIHPAMKKGEFDLYTEYTGTAWSMVLGRQSGYLDADFSELSREYKDKFKMSWLGEWGFANSYAIAVRREVADEFGLRTISDLAKVSRGLRFGAEHDFFERDDGFLGLSRTYGLWFASKTDLDIGLKYTAINEGKIDVMPIFTTDGLFGVSDLVVLDDDRHFYPSYRAVNVVRDEALAKFKRLGEVLESVRNLIDQKQMARLNFAVESGRLNPRQAALELLEQKGMLR